MEDVQPLGEELGLQKLRENGWAKKAFPKEDILQRFHLLLARVDLEVVSEASAELGHNIFEEHAVPVADIKYLEISSLVASHRGIYMN